jgi:hypothetical protein
MTILPLALSLSAGYFTVSVLMWWSDTDALLRFRSWWRRKVARLRREFSRASAVDVAAEIERTWL